MFPYIISYIESVATCIHPMVELTKSFYVSVPDKRNANSTYGSNLTKKSNILSKGNSLDNQHGLNDGTHLLHSVETISS